MGCGDGVCNTSSFENCLFCSADCGMCGTANCRQTISCLLGCTSGGGGIGGIVGCVANCTARACMAARTAIFESAFCIVMNVGACGDNPLCLVNRCPALFQCFFQGC
jgi:hypothetical protein